MGQGMYMYETEVGRLPRQHPAIFRNQGIDYLMENPIASFNREAAEYQQTRFLSGALKEVFGDSSQQRGSMADEVSTCPTMVGIVPDTWFEQHRQQEGKAVFPTHYVLNNPGFLDADTANPGQAKRITDPVSYFGYSPPQTPGPNGWPGALQAQVDEYRPRPIEQIRRTADEWAIADAWYRFNTQRQIKQEGPYQSGWSGTALPNFAPHGARLQYPSGADRNTSSANIREAQADGSTNTLFFDGHAESVKSKKATTGGGRRGFDLGYGFPGTVNPLDEAELNIIWE
jgi:prepilin-type processing-associated H-X9-DG protein